MAGASRSCASSLELALYAQYELRDDGSDGEKTKRQTRAIDDGSTKDATAATSTGVSLTRDELSARFARETESALRYHDRVRRDELAKPLRFHVMTYGITSTAGFLRHVYLRLGDVELHAGMTGDTSRQLMYCTRDYYGAGRSEGFMTMCARCADDLLADIERKTEKFFLPIVNCDTIVPIAMQTFLIWLSILGFLVGVLLASRAQNFFTFAMFVPAISLCATLLYNRFLITRCENDDHPSRQLSRCAHV